MPAFQDLLVVVNVVNEAYAGTNGGASSRLRGGSISRVERGAHAIEGDEAFARLLPAVDGRRDSHPCETGPSPRRASGFQALGGLFFKANGTCSVVRPCTTLPQIHLL